MSKNKPQSRFAEDDDSLRVSFHLPAQLFAELDAEAKREGMALSSHIRRILAMRKQTLAAREA